MAKEKKPFQIKDFIKPNPEKIIQQISTRVSNISLGIAPLWGLSLAPGWAEASQIGISSVAYLGIENLPTDERIPFALVAAGLIGITNMAYDYWTLSKHGYTGNMYTTMVYSLIGNKEISAVAGKAIQTAYLVVTNLPWLAVFDGDLFWTNIMVREAITTGANSVINRLINIGEVDKWGNAIKPVLDKVTDKVKNIRKKKGD